MKRFIIQILVFCLLASMPFFWLLSTADGYTDSFYVRFTTPKKEAMIIGTSRAAQDLVPRVLKENLQQDFYNYAFSVNHSPHGPAYFNSIRKKLKENTKDAIFIVTVDPWSISSETENPDDSVHFTENILCVATTSNVNTNPNFEYLLENFAGNYGSLLNRSKRVLVHEDGWLEVTVPMDSASIAKRVASKVQEYSTTKLPFYKLSKVRLEYLQKTINFLKEHGDVYLVRVPVHPEIFKMELQLMPDFDNVISRIIPTTRGYLDLTKNNERYIYTDGNHLWKNSAIEATKEVCNWILADRRK